MNNLHLVIGLLVLLVLFYQLQLHGSNNLHSSFIENHSSSINSTNLGFVKPEHRLLKILNTQIFCLSVPVPTSSLCLMNKLGKARWPFT